MTIPVSVTLPQFHPEAQPLVEAGRDAEHAGFAGVFLFDHLYPLDGPQRPVVELFAALGALAAATTRIRIGTLVLRASTRPPRTSAAGLWAAQAISGGRVVAAIGAGDKASQGEMEAYGLAFEPLARRLDMVRETVSAIRRQPIDDLPVPPVWLGGRLEVVRRLAAEVADGWNGWGGDQAQFAEEATQVRGWASQPMTVSWGGAVLLAHDSDELEQLVSRRGGTEGVVAGTPDMVAGVLAGLVEAGADELVLSLLPSNRPQPTWELFVEKVWPRLG